MGRRNSAQQLFRVPRFYAAAWTRVLITQTHARAAGDGTRLAVEAARSAAGGAVGRRRGGCGVRGGRRYGVLADHLAAHSEEAAVRDWPSCGESSQLCKLGDQWQLATS